MVHSMVSVDEIQAVAERLEAALPPEILSWVFATFEPESVALACSFGAEDVALAHLVSEVHPGARVFYLDTDVLFPETYATRDRLAAALPLRFERVAPKLSLEEQAARHGEGLWGREPDRCCHIRKVEPLQRVLSGLAAWITGIRRDQAPARHNARVVEWDQKFGLVKVNPLVRWTWEEVWGYIKAYEVPYNPLHEQGYPSIGCVHCTRQVQPGEDPRAGRWSGLGKTECGLHG